ncbi:hypothetical protein EfmAA290_25440 [Enterococcus faecium]|nr:hypothetical protein EfmAA290_25440 [Enterococcus faecium]
MGINESFFQLTFFINKRVSTERIEKIVNPKNGKAAYLYNGYEKSFEKAFKKRTFP